MYGCENGAFRGTRGCSEKAGAMILVDTGPLVALFDQRDTQRAR